MENKMGYDGSLKVLLKLAIVNYFIMLVSMLAVDFFELSPASNVSDVTIGMLLFCSVDYWTLAVLIYPTLGLLLHRLALRKIFRRKYMQGFVIVMSILYVLSVLKSSTGILDFVVQFVSETGFIALNIWLARRFTLKILMLKNKPA